MIKTLKFSLLYPNQCDPYHGIFVEQRLRKLVLATDREGMANVVLEPLACGTPVVATPAGGIPEILTVLEAGVLMKERTPADVVVAVKALFDRYPRREDTRRFAETLNWDATTRGRISLFRRVLDGRGHAGPEHVVAAAPRRC